MLTRKQLEVAIIRCAERFPDRVSSSGDRMHDNPRGHCIIGQVLCDAGFCRNWIPFMGLIASDPVAAEMSTRAIHLNNEGHPWKDIPRLLGLTAGELAPESVEESVEEVVAC